MTIVINEGGLRLWHGSAVGNMASSVRWGPGLDLAATAQR